MAWKGLSLFMNSESPIVVVLSYVGTSSSRLLYLIDELHVQRGSMEPAFYRGDILFLTNFARDGYRIGDIPVYKM